MLHAGAEARVPAVKTRALAARRYRSIHPGEDRSGRSPARAGCLSRDARAAALLQSHWPAADAGADRRFRRSRRRSDRPRARGRSWSMKLLASPRFGEAWGRHWLDVARFAESSGGGRTLLFKDAWRYRDYVIEAFNANVPFDRFIREQLAGDLLPAATPAEQRRQLTATAFLALGPTNYEEQDKQQLRFDVIDEQIDTIGKAFLGQTIGCARCHDHKFDPIPQRDYYALAGILASTRTLLSYTENVARWISAPLPGDRRREAALQRARTESRGGGKADSTTPRPRRPSFPKA